MGVVLVDRAAGTLIGNMTANGGNGAAFDGLVNQALLSCARISGFATSGFVGKLWDSPKIFAGGKLYGANNQGFFDTDNRSCILNVRGVNFSATAPTDGSVIGTSGAFNDTANESAGRNVISSDLVNAYICWVAQVLLNAGGTAQMNCAEVEWSEIAGGSLLIPTNPMAHMLVR